MSTHAYACAPNLEKAKVVIFGANIQGAGFSQSFRGSQSRGASLHFSADAIRSAHAESPSLPTDGRRGTALWDAGNLELSGSAAAQMDAIREATSEILERGKTPVGLGGDHLIKIAMLRAVAKKFPRCGILYLDAHPDCVQNETPSFDSVLHHAFREKSFSPARTCIVGLRQVRESETAGLEFYSPRILDASEFRRLGHTQRVMRVLKAFAGCKTVFVSVDLDGLDPASAPAVEAPYPGGPTVDEFVNLMQSLAKKIKFVGMDVSEFMPTHDPSKLTALTADRIVKEFYACVA